MVPLAQCAESSPLFVNHNNNKPMHKTKIQAPVTRASESGLSEPQADSYPVTLPELIAASKNPEDQFVLFVDLRTRIGRYKFVSELPPSSVLVYVTCIDGLAWMTKAHAFEQMLANSRAMLKREYKKFTHKRGSG